MTSFLTFLGNSPLGSALKVGLGAVLAYVIDNIGTFDLPPVVSVFIVAFTPAIINWLNPEDVRYGRIANEYLVDLED